MTTDNMGTTPVPLESLTRRVSRNTPADPIGQLRAAMAHHDRQAREANRPTGTELRHTAQLVDSQHDDITHAVDEAARARDVADRAAYKAADAAETAGEARDAALKASVAADRAGEVARRVDGSRVVAADARETPVIGPVPVRLVEETVPVVAGYGRARVSLAVFGMVPSRGPVALQVRLRVGDRVTPWVTASYAGDGVTYPGGMAPVRSFSLAGFEDDVDQGGVLAVEAMCPVKGMYPKSGSGMAHLSARVDYMEVV